MIVDRKVSKDAVIGWKPRLLPRLRDGVLTAPVITANADPTKFDVSAFSYVLNGRVHKSVAAAANVFSAVHATGIGKWLGIGLYIDERGTISTLASPNTGDQDYDTEALAVASIPASTVASLKFGSIRLLTTGADWDANTDALNAVDLAAANLLGEFPDRRWDVLASNTQLALVGAQSYCRSAAGTLHFEAVLGKEGVTQVLTDPHLEVDRRTVADAAVIKLRHSAFDALIDGVLYHFAAAQELAFTAAHVVTANKWGAILLQVSTAGAWSTLVGEATQTTAMAYTSAALARAALPATAAGKIAVGILVVEAGGANWDANTDDIVAGSDLEGFDLVPALPDRLLDAVDVSITVGEAEDFSVTAFDYVIGGVRYTKAATANLDFSANHVATASKYLAILLGINSAGTVSSKVPLIDGRSQTDTQGYDSFDEAMAALPTPSAGVLPFAAVVVLADAGGWTANTDDLTPGSDLTNSWLVGFTPEQALAFVADAAIPSTVRNRLWPLSGGAFVSNVATNATLEGGILAARADEDAPIAIFVGASADAVVDAPEVTAVFRPWPMAAE